MKKRKNIILILVVVLLTLLIIGISYAWLRTVVKGNKNIQITVGEISIVLDDASTNGINLVDAIPTYDSVGKTNEPYTFSLANESKIDLYYTLSLVDDEEALSSCSTTDGSACKLLDPRDIRYELKIGDKTITGSLSDSEEIPDFLPDRFESVTLNLP